MNHSTVTYQTIGSSAVRPEFAPRLVVLNGGSHSTRQSSRRVLERPQRLHRLTAKEQKLDYSVRLVCLAALVSVMVTLSVCLGISFGLVGTTTSALAEQPTTQITVLPGDSLWTIAANHPIEGYTTQDLVSYICTSNELESSLLRPGQKLVIPTSLS